MKSEMKKKPKCPKCGNVMQPYNAVSPKDFICLVCLYSTRTNKPTRSLEGIKERCCPEE